MSTILSLDHWDDKAAIAQLFHARTPSMPVFASGTKCFFTNPFEGVHGDASRWRHNNHGELRIEPDNWEFHPDRLVMKVAPMAPITMPDGPQSYKGAALVSNFSVQEGVILIDATFSGVDQIVEAIWLMTTPYYGRSKQEINNPETDLWETGTPGHPNEMSKSVILGYNPTRAINVEKMPIQPFAGKRHTYEIDIRSNKIIGTSTVGDTWSVRRPQLRMPVYLIIWIAVSGHQNFVDPVAHLDIHSIKLLSYA